MPGRCVNRRGESALALKRTMHADRQDRAPMKKLLLTCVAASLTLANAWAQNSAPVAPANGAAPEAVNKEAKKEAEKRPKPTKKSRKPAPRSSNP
jgi:hypothetical protein